MCAVIGTPHLCLNQKRTEQPSIGLPHDRPNSFSDRSVKLIHGYGAHLLGSAWQFLCKRLGYSVNHNLKGRGISCLKIRSSWALPRSHSQSVCRLARPRLHSTDPPLLLSQQIRPPSSIPCAGSASE